MTNRFMLLRICSLLLGIFLTVSGALFLLLPQAGSAVFGHSLGEPTLLKTVGVRQLAFGLVISSLALRGEPRPLAVVMMVGAMVPAVDGWIVWEAVGPLTALRHLIAVPFCVGVAIALWREPCKK